MSAPPTTGCDLPVLINFPVVICRVSVAFYVDLDFTRYSAGVSLVSLLNVWQK